MADEIDDADLELAQMAGIENSWAGRVLRHLVRSVKFLRLRANNLNERVSALEQRLPPP